MNAPQGVRDMMDEVINLSLVKTMEVKTTLVSGACSLPGAINGLTSQFTSEADGKVYRVTIEEVQR